MLNYGIDGKLFAPRRIARSIYHYRAGGVAWPEGVELASGVGARVYERGVEIRGELRPIGSQGTAVRLSFQACDDRRCLPPASLLVNASP